MMRRLKAGRQGIGGPRFRSEAIHLDSGVSSLTGIASWYPCINEPANGANDRKCDKGYRNFGMTIHAQRN